MRISDSGVKINMMNPEMSGDILQLLDHYLTNPSIPISAAKYRGDNNLGARIKKNSKDIVRKRNISLNEVDLVHFLKITKKEYEESWKDVKDAYKKLNEENITGIFSCQKLTNQEQKVVEFFLTLIGYKPLNLLKNKLKLNEIKDQMRNIEIKALNVGTINSFLNQICKNQALPSIMPEPGINVLYHWIKAVLRIFLYQFQNNNVYETLNSKITTKASISTIDIGSKTIEHSLKLHTQQSPVVNFQNKSTFEKNKNFVLLTGLNRNNKRDLPIFPKVKKAKVFSKSMIKKSLIRLNVDYTEEHNIKESKVMSSLPLLKHKTFHDMRVYYQLVPKENSEIYSKHHEDVRNFASKDPKNANKLIKMLTRKNIRVLQNISAEQINNIFNQ